MKNGGDIMRKLIIIFFFPYFQLLAQSGADIDIDFGENGFTLVDINREDRGLDIAIQTDGKILQSGMSKPDGEWLITTVRYTTSGNLDSSWGGDGIVTTDIGENYDVSRSVLLQDDGKVVVVGGSSRNSSGIEDVNFLAIRYNTDGGLDETFGDNGIASFNIQGSSELVESGVIGKNGNIYIAGQANNTENNYDVAILSINSEGTLLTDFGQEGVAIADIDGNRDAVYDVITQTDGKIIAVGSTQLGNASGFNALAIFRFNQNGTLDNQFANGGSLVIDMVGSSGDVGRAVKVQRDGKILVTGGSNGRIIFVIRLNQDGSLDSSFGDEGISFISVEEEMVEAYDLEIQSDGKIIVVGQHWDQKSNLVVARLLRNGSLDSKFGGNGIVIFSLSDYYESAQSVAVQEDGRIVIGGWATKSWEDFLVLRLVGDPPVAVDLEFIQPTLFYLHTNYPNPFNPTTTISYDLPKRSQVTLGIYDLLGKRIKTLLNQSQDVGVKTVRWDGTDEFGRQVSAGVYLYQIKAGEFTQTRKMLLLK